MTPPTGVDATRRTRLANERTFLSWWRTALGAQGVAVAIGRILPEVSEGPHWPYVVLGTLLSLLGSALGAIGWWRYADVNRALTGGEEAVAPAWLMPALSAPLVFFGAVLAVLIVVA
jgi:putative membrane protein